MSRHAQNSRRLPPRTYCAALGGLTLLTATSVFLSVLTASVWWLALIGAGLVGWTVWPGWNTSLTCPDPGCLQCANWYWQERSRTAHPDQNGTEILAALRRGR